jgi:hypothetical protein
MIFCLDALVAWLSLTRFAMDKLEDWSYQYLKLDCKDKDRCYGVLAVSGLFANVTSATKGACLDILCSLASPHFRYIESPLLSVYSTLSSV